MIGTAWNDDTEIARGTDPNNEDECPGDYGPDNRCGGGRRQGQGFAPVPGCGPWGICFTSGPGETLFNVDQLLDLSATLSDFLRLGDQSPLLSPWGTAGSGAPPSAARLLSVFAVVGDSILVVVPPGQEVQAVLHRPLLNIPGVDTLLGRVE
jgi:hypothetical protein